jgi:PD-(D/E)XK nuclease superfamily protein
MEQLKINPRMLASVALPSACPRCAWLTLRFEGKLPYASRMPGIFSSIDSFTKKSVRNHFDLYGRLPDWFPDVGMVADLAPSRDLQWSRFFREDPETRIRLQGVPDDILRMADGSTHIVDYKTARLTDAQDDLMPVYEVQLNGYAYIAEATGYGPVAHLSLIYFEPQTDSVPEDLHASVATQASHGGLTLVPARGFEPRDRGGAWLEFRARRKDVRLQGSQGIRDLLARARSLADRADPPDGAPGCEDCRRLEELWRLLS